MDGSIFNQIGRALATIVSETRTTLQTQIDALQTSIQNLGTTSTDALANDLANETSARIAADTTLQNNIDTEKDRIDSEISARTDADVTLQNNINNKLNINSNAVSASKLLTPRTISLSGDVSGSTTFDGSGDANITVAIGDNNHGHSIANVSGLQTVLDQKLDTETVTSISLVANVLSYVDENGSTTQIDLSTYLDDTNLARVISGEYNSTTKEMVFTRDDDTTFSIDASMFYDGNSTVTSVAGKTGAVTLVKADVGLDSVDNTSDLNKPVSTATQTALDGKQDADVNLVSDASYVHTDNNYTSTDKIKLENIEANANNYVLPVASGVLGGVKSGTDITVDVSGNVSVNDNTHNHTIENITGLQTELNKKSDKWNWSIQTDNYTASASDAIACDTTTQAFTVTLPISPTLGDTIKIVDASSNFATNNLIIGRNGHNIMGLAEDMTISSNNVAFELVYINVELGWRLFY